MRLVQFVKDNTQRIGLLSSHDGSVLDLTSQDPAQFPPSMLDFLRAASKEPQRMEAARLKSLEKSLKYVYQGDQVKLLAPVTAPDKVICIGMNYADHCAEQGVPCPVEPVIFNKFPSSIVGPQDDLAYPVETEKLDWEVEMTLVIGKTGYRIPKSEAMSHLAGYTVAHDVSARDWQLEKNGGQWLVGKTMNGFCPLGPAIVTPDEVPDPDNLDLWCRVNGVVRQSSNTRQMVHRTPDLIAFVSRFFTLYPGDVILTGTPPGVGVFMKPPVFLNKGDVVECEIQNIGLVRNKVV